MRSVTSNSCIETQSTHFMSNNFFSENSAIYETRSKNVAEPERPQITIWRRVACWINKATFAQAHVSVRALTLTQALTRMYALRARERTHTHTHRNM